MRVEWFAFACAIRLYLRVRSSSTEYQGSGKGKLLAPSGPIWRWETRARTPREISAPSDRGSAVGPELGLELELEFQFQFPFRFPNGSLVAKLVAISWISPTLPPNYPELYRTRVRLGLFRALGSDAFHTLSKFVSQLRAEDRGYRINSVGATPTHCILSLLLL